ncbi:MAG: flagellar basal body P-ring formation chaperone FlgA [Candidatus Phaeomarinobacter sp.]
MSILRTFSLRAIVATAVLATAGIAGHAEAAPTEAVLRDKAMVSGDTVTLGDLFINAGNQATALVSRAPAPGARAAINANHVAAAARAAGMLWPNNERYTHLIVNREGTQVPMEMVTTTLANTIARAEAANTPFDVSYSLVLDADPKPMFVARGDMPEVIVEDMSFDARSGLFSARITTPAHGAAIHRVTGRAKQTREVPVAATSVARGEILTHDMLTVVDMEVSRIAPGTALNIEDLLGMTPRTALRVGQPVRTKDMRLPVTVAKDSRVTITFEMPGMVLTPSGRPLEDAPTGGIIRVINTRSHRTVHARVTGPGQVVIEGGTQMQVANSATN